MNKPSCSTHTAEKQPQRKEIILLIDLGIELTITKQLSIKLKCDTPATHQYLKIENYKLYIDFFKAQLLD